MGTYWLRVECKTKFRCGRNDEVQYANAKNIT